LFKKLKYKTIDDYIDASAENIREVLQKVRQTIKSVIPEATEIFGYRVPSFDINGKHVVMFARFKNHIGIYPTPAVIENLKKDLKDYKTAKGSIQFQLDETIPYNLIKKGLISLRVFFNILS